MTIGASFPDELMYYDPRLFVYHLVRSEIWGLRYNVHAAFAAGRYLYRVNSKSSNNIRPGDKHQLLMQSFRALLGLCFDVGAWSIFLRDRRRYPYVQNYLLENTSEYVRRLGRLYEQYTNAV